MKHIRPVCLFTLCVLSVACGAGSSQQVTISATDAASSGSAAQHLVPATATKSADTPAVATKAASSAVATDTDAASPVPDELKAFVPPDMKLLVYKTTGTTEGSDAVAVLERKKKYTADPDATAEQRLLLLFRREDGALREVARNDKIIGCPTCGEEMDDPFLPDGVELKQNHLIIEQDHGELPSTATYKFLYDAKTQQWEVTSAINTHYDQPVLGGAPPKTVSILKLPNPPLLTSFDPGWRTPQFWNAIVVNENAQSFVIIDDEPDEKSLDSRIQDSCKVDGKCTVLVKQNYGCMALVKDGAGQFYTGTSLSKKRTAGKDAVDSALRQCNHKDRGSCEVVRHDCSTGFH